MTVGTQAADNLVNLADAIAYGLDGNDYIYFNASVSAIYADGGRGNDIIYGSGNNDVLIGGENDDSIFFTSFSGADLAGSFADGGRGNDAIYGSSFADSVLGGEGADYLSVGAGADVVFSGNGNDTVFGGGGLDLIYGDGGNDVISGNDDADILDGVGGDDSILGGNGNDFISGDAGNDTLRGEIDIDTLYGKDGDDVLFGGSGNDIMYGGIGNDTYEVTEIGDVIAEEGSALGGGGFDVVYSSVNFALPFGIEQLILVASAQYGYGSASDNVLVGNTLDNVLEGGAGYDYLTGGGGADRFVSRDNFGVDIITDFSSGLAGTDVIFLSNTQFVSGFASVLAQSAQVGLDTWIGDGLGNTLVLTNVARTQLATDDFAFL